MLLLNKLVQLRYIYTGCFKVSFEPVCYNNVTNFPQPFSKSQKMFDFAVAHWLAPIRQILERKKRTLHRSPKTSCVWMRHLLVGACASFCDSDVNEWTPSLVQARSDEYFDVRHRALWAFKNSPIV